jgi:hypothetical protein
MRLVPPTLTGILLVAACTAGEPELQLSRAALGEALPPGVTLTGCGASNLINPGDAGVPPARSFVVQDLDGVPGIQCPGCVDGLYTLQPENWKEVLGLIYAGLQRDGSKDCNGDLRRSLVASWGGLFPSSCNAGCTALRRAWRPEDRAPATAALMAALGLSMPPERATPGAQPAPIDLCNAYGAGPLFAGDADYLDRDPIRVNSVGTDKEEVSDRIGRLGLVTAVAVPSNLTQAQAYPAQLCGIGQFAFLQPALFLPPRVRTGSHRCSASAFSRFRDSRMVRSTPAVLLAAFPPAVSAGPAHRTGGGTTPCSPPALAPTASTRRVGW